MGTGIHVLRRMPYMLYVRAHAHMNVESTRALVSYAYERREFHNMS